MKIQVLVLMEAMDDKKKKCSIDFPKGKTIKLFTVLIICTQYL